MKRGDFLWLALFCGLTTLLIVPTTHHVFIVNTQAHPYIMGFVKFAVLATLGELLAIRKLSPEAQTLLEQAFSRLGLSARGYDRVLKVARTIADLAGEEVLSTQAVAEAVHLRNSVKESLMGV